MSTALRHANELSKGSLRMATCQHPTSSLLFKISGSNFSTHKNQGRENQNRMRKEFGGAALLAFMGLGAAALCTDMVNQPAAIADDKKEETEY